MYPVTHSAYTAERLLRTSTMIHYLLAHTAHHLSRWLHHKDQTRLLVTVLLLGVALVVPQVYVLQRPSSSRFCSQPLLTNLVGFIGFTFFATGFALLLVLIDPIPGWLRFSFSVFGGASFLEGAVTFLLTSLAKECAINTPELYYVSMVLSVASILSTGFYLVLAPFWLLNYTFPGLVLNKASGTGICYEAATSCPCLWHV